ncbi:MAG: glycosyltransferase, partial [Thermoplasmata archaeon]
MRRWAEHFSKANEVLVISDSSEKIPGVRVETVFKKRAGVRNVPKIAKMRRIVREFAPDIVHGHYLTVGGFYAAFSGGRKIVGSAWGSDVYYGPEQSFKERMILRSALKRLDLVFVGTMHMAQRVRAYGYHGDIRIFRWGADPNLFRKLSHHGTGEFRVLSIRPCDRIYNPIVVLNAFKLILPELKNAYLYLFDFGNVIGMVHEIL